MVVYFFMYTPICRHVQLMVRSTTGGGGVHIPPIHVVCWVYVIRLMTGSFHHYHDEEISAKILGSVQILAPITVRYSF